MSNRKQNDISRTARDATVSRLTVVAIVGVAAAICLAGLMHVRTRYSAFDGEIHSRLLVIAENKSVQLDVWRRERLADAHTLAASTKLMPTLDKVMRGSGTPEQTRQVQSMLDAVRVQYNYENVVLVSAAGNVRLASGPLQGDESYYRKLADATSGSAFRYYFNDFSRASTGGHPRLSLSVAVSSADDKPLGVLVLGIDPTHYPYPTLRNWPGAGRTGELLLVQSSGDSILYLNESRWEPGSALRLRKPFALTELTSAAHRPGNRADGVDYRGMSTVASLQPVFGTNWYIVAKMDRAEAFEPMDREAAQIGVFCALLIALTSAAGLVLVRRYRSQIRRDKREAESARQALLERYEILARFANDAILLSTRDGRIVEANERASSMFGYSREELLDLSLFALKPESQKAHFSDMLERIYTEKSLLYESLNVRKDGSVIPTEVSACLVQVDGQTMCQAIVRDISERKETERQIARLNHLYAVLSRCNAVSFRAESEEQLFHDVCATSVESGGFRIAWVGRVEPETLRIVPVATAGPGAAYLQEIRIVADSGPLGSGPAGRCIREGRPVAAPDYTTDPAMVPWREAAARHGLRSAITLPIKRHGQTVNIFGLFSSEPAFFSAEEIELVAEVGKGFSLALDRLDLHRERAISERQLRITTERLELALEASNEAYFDWRTHTDKWYVTPRFFTMLGYEPGEFVVTRERVLEMQHPDDATEARRKGWMLMSGKASSCRVELRIRTKSGQYVWAETHFKVAERDGDGRVTRLVGTRSDITKRKLLEQEFQQAQKMESVGRLAGAVAHDFNNFLTVINGYSSLMLEEVPPDSSHGKYLSAIHDAGQRSAALTRQLLLFGRKGIEKKEILDPNQAITSAQKLLSRMMRGHVELRLELAPDAGPVLADPTQFEQVVMNLGINAGDAIPGRGTVTIRTERVTINADESTPDRAGTFVRLTVADDGTGISPEVQAHMFEPFFTTKAKGVGTGLGLATVHSIVEGCGGFIQVETEVGQGTSFLVYFPVAEGAVVPVSTPATEVPRATKGTGTILLVEDVEDDDSVRNLGGNILKAAGYRVLAASNGESGLGISANYRSRIDLVVSDVLMPGMSGPEMVRSLQQSRPGLRVLYVSGYAHDYITLEDLAASGAVYLQKPYSPNILLDTLGDLLAGVPGHGGGAA